MLVSELVNSKSNKVPEWSFTGENASVETGRFCNAEDCFQRAFIFCVSRLTGTEENAQLSLFHVSGSIVSPSVQIQMATEQGRTKEGFLLTELY